MYMHTCILISAGVSSCFGIGSEDGHVPTFWLLLECVSYLVSKSRTWHHSCLLRRKLAFPGRGLAYLSLFVPNEGDM